MKITLGDLRDSQPALNVLIDKELDITTAFKLSKAVKIIDKELKDLEEFRMKLIKKYGIYDDKQKAFTVKEDNQPKFYEEFGKLLDTKVDIKFTKISIKDLGDIKITAKQLALLDPFIKEK